MSDFADSGHADNHEHESAGHSSSGHDSGASAHHADGGAGHHDGDAPAHHDVAAAGGGAKIDHQLISDMYGLDTTANDGAPAKTVKIPKGGHAPMKRMLAGRIATAIDDTMGFDPMVDDIEGFGGWVADLMHWEDKANREYDEVMKKSGAIGQAPNVGKDLAQVKHGTSEQAWSAANMFTKTRQSIGNLKTQVGIVKTIIGQARGQYDAERKRYEGIADEAQAKELDEKISEMEEEADLLTRIIGDVLDPEEGLKDVLSLGGKAQEAVIHAAVEGSLDVDGLKQQAQALHEAAVEAARDATIIGMKSAANTIERANDNIADIQKEAAELNGALGNQRAHAEADYDKASHGSFKFGSEGHGGTVGRISDLDELKKLTFDCMGDYNAAAASADAFGRDIVGGKGDAIKETETTLTVSKAVYAERSAAVSALYYGAAARAGELKDEREQADETMAQADPSSGP